MTDASQERLYALLPTIYRIRDSEQGQPLRTLLGLMEGQLRVLEADIRNLYRNWFIETCEPWAIPYVADLLGVQGLASPSQAGFDPRAFVANTIAYRRRKGTVAVLEQLAADVTDWPSHAGEFYQRLAVTQYLNHVRLNSPATVDVRDAARLELLEGPFDATPHTVDVRRIEVDRGRYNVPNVGLFLWRLRPYPIRGGDPGSLAGFTDGRCTFDPLGRDVPLFGEGKGEEELTHLSEEIDVPARLRRRALYDELEAYRQALARNETPPELPHFGDTTAFRVYTGTPPQPVPPEQIAICDLSAWDRPAASRTYLGPDRQPRSLPIALAVDPELGRITFPDGAVPSSVRVDYVYGFSADMGGGPYDRLASLPDVVAEATWLVSVSRDQAPSDSVVGTLAEGVSKWNAQEPGVVGVIALLDGHTYEEDLTGGSGQGPSILLPDGSRLLIVAAKSAAPLNSGAPLGAQNPGVSLSPSDLRPVLRGSVSMQGTAPADSEDPGSLFLNGLWVDGGLSVQPGNLGLLSLTHCTLAPTSSTLAAASTEGQRNRKLVVHLEKCICGPISLADGVPTLEVRGCVVDAGAGAAVDGTGTHLAIDDSTVFGTVSGQTLDASNTIFMGAVQIVRRQTGCARFCYVPADISLTPRRYRCQPDLGLEGLTGDLASLAVRFRPSFTSTRCGDPGYAQLGERCPDEIRTGAEDESEMGAFRPLLQPQREASLRLRLAEYLPAGMEAGIIHVT